MSDQDFDSSVMRFVEFETVSGEYWSMERFDRLAEDFSVFVADLPKWHKLMTGQGRAWEICERLYQVGSLVNPSNEILRSWSRAEIGKFLGIPKGQVDHEIDNAVGVWKLAKARQDVTDQSVSGATHDEIEHLTNFSNADGIEKEVVDKLLTAFNFSDVKDEGLRAQVAKRILSLKDYLSSPHTRTAAREVIRMEVTMHGLEKILVSYQNKIEALVEDDPDRKSRGAEIDGLSKKAQELDEEIRKIGKEHAARQKSIGADDIDMTTRKRIIVETVAYIQEKCKEYESDPANVLVDGVFRAGEIDWLLEPLGAREAQYRPDISVRIAEALLPENLWNPEYQPTKIPQRICQELRKIVETIRGIPEDAVPLADSDEEDEDESGVSDGADIALDDAGGSDSSPPIGIRGRKPMAGASVMGVY